MEDFTVLASLFFLLIIVTLVGHGIWVAVRGFIRLFTDSKPAADSLDLSSPMQAERICRNCGYALNVGMKFCGICGAQSLTQTQEEHIRELEITLRQLERLHETGSPDEVTFRVLKIRIATERERTLFPNGLPGIAKQPSLFVPEIGKVQTSPKLVEKEISAQPVMAPASLEERPYEQSAPQLGEWLKDSDEAPLAAPDLTPTRKPFADVLAAFMEESNVRWGEIIGGLLIIGCSTALVISLWAQISRVPVMKFFIFTTVTAALFGVGFYAARHWKLPTTSRGILTIATLLVPLNFLAIAAVSTNTAPGTMVVGSEFIAPALFLCLVYFAGRVIASKWPHVLAAGALGSSIGQLLIRHFAHPDISANLLVALGAFPLVCYVVASGWGLKIALADGEIDELESIEIFTTLGALTFAAALPFGLLLYKSESIAMSIIHLAPLVTLGGMPMVASGMFLWRRSSKELNATRTAGASIAILGTATSLAGMVLAWPNPASIIPAALFNFGLFTTVAVTLEEPRAHVLATACLTFGYVIGFHVLLGHVPWENLRVTSLLKVTNSVSTGQSLTIPFVTFVVAHEWLRSKRDSDAFSYLIAACCVAVASLIFLVVFGLGVERDPFHISAIAALYAGGAFWFAWRRKFVGLTWAGVALLFLAIAQTSHSLLLLRFPWQASGLFFALICVTGALAAHLSKKETEQLFVAPLLRSAIAGLIIGASFIVVELVSLRCEPAAVFATRTLIFAAVMLGLLILKRSSLVFTAFQISLALGAILFTKTALQHFGWYGFQPNVWLHPWALQIQGIILGLMCLAWIATRSLARKRAGPDSEQGERTHKSIIPEMPLALDHVLALGLVIGFSVLVIYGSASGISKELTNATRVPREFDLAGFSHTLIFGVGSLALLAVLFAVMFTNLRERRNELFGLGTLVVLWCICPLVAGRFESHVATASAGRWALAIYLVILSMAYAFREKFARQAPGARAGWLTNARALVLFSTLVPLAFLTLSPAVDDVNYVPARGPQSGIFRAMGSVVLYGVPLMIAAAALMIHAARERSAAFAFAAGLLINFTVTTVHIVSVAQVNGPMNRIVLVNALQLNAIAAASVAIVWVATRRWWMQADIPLPEGEGITHTSEPILLTCQKFLPVALNILLIVPLALHLIAVPQRVGRGTFAAGSFTGWLALLLTIAAAITIEKVLTKPLQAIGLAASLVAVASLASFRGAELGVANWAGLHIFLGALVIVAWLLLLARDFPLNQLIAGALSKIDLGFHEDWAWDCEVFAAFVGAIAVLVALRGPFNDPTGAWWSIGALLTMSTLATSLNWVIFRRGYVYAAGILFNLAVSIWLIKYQSHPVSSLSAFVEANVVALSLTGILWLILELRTRRAAPSSATSSRASFHNVAALASLTTIVAVVMVRLHDDLYGFYQTLFPLLDLFALVSITALMFACLWDSEAKYSVPSLYVIGLLGAATFLHHRQLTPRHLIWSLAMAAAIQAFVAVLLWRLRRPLIATATRLKIPPRVEPSTEHQLEWLFIFNAIVVALLVVIVLWFDVVFVEWPLRALASAAVIVQAFTFGLMAEGERRRSLQRAAVAMLLIGLVFLGWSFLTSGTTGTWLNRAVILMTLMFATVALFGLNLDKMIERRLDWTKAVRDCVPAITITGIVALAYILATEVYYQAEFGAVRVPFLALLTVGVTLAASIVVCILFAILPKHDPLSLPDRRRGSYVYVAEVLMVLLFMHIRLTMPWLFHGFFQRYWPLVVLAIAYAGVGISEFFKRRDVPVLAQPIERTGAFLPLLPVIGFWIAQSQVEYSTLLFIVGGLYGLLSILRRSFWFGLAAALAGNGGLWHLLHETSDYHFFQHPQFWLIPAAISVLIAAHLNRKDFSESQMTSIRYLCLATIYVSSTADIFINGVANSPWLPLILAALSVAGVFAGMIFRIRAFLLLGSAFLLLAIATMINYASVNFGWTWLWYVAGIFTGMAIIATFAVFEKKRTEVLRLVDGLKEWQK